MCATQRPNSILGFHKTKHVRECVILHLHLIPRNPHILKSSALNIHVTNSASPPPQLLGLYSSETTTWNRCSLSVEPPVAYGATWLKCSIYLDGILYKLMKSKHLLHLDIEAMRADAIELPCTDEIDEYGFIGELKGVLHYANHNGIKLMIWQFDFLCKTDCFWILKHYISIHDLAAKHPARQNLFVQRDSNMLKPYAIHPTSNIIFLGIPEMIFSYHLNMQKLELFFGAQDDRKIVWGQIFVFAYSCCFVILNDYSRTHWSFSSCKYHLVLFSYRVWFFHLAQSYGHVL